MLPESLKSIKKELYFLCMQFVEQRIVATQKAIKAAQESANEDSKSSMGDKYETSRAMAQLEVEKNTVQLAEAIKLKRALELTPIETASTKVQTGSVVETDNGNYYMAISAGKLMIGNDSYFAVSTSSPLGSKLLGLQVGEVIEMNGRTLKLEKVY